MHKFMRSIGFHEERTRKEINEILTKVITTAEAKSYTTLQDGTLYGEYRKECGDGFGICVRGEMDDDNTFYCDYYFPYLTADSISSMEDIMVERQSEKLSYAGAVDDFKVGASIIFYLQNMISYLKFDQENRLPIRGTSISFSGLAESGKILFPIKKNERDIRRINSYNQRKNRLISAAKNGDEDAIENLTLDDMDTNSVIQKRILKDDVFTLVDTYFIPYGMECDLYSILGEITDFRKKQNIMTKEEIYILGVNVNDLIFNICINEKDLMGEPQVGRRFKGTIWMQGYVNYPE